MIRSPLISLKSRLGKLSPLSKSSAASRAMLHLLESDLATLSFNLSLQTLTVIDSGRGVYYSAGVGTHRVIIGSIKEEW
jgi:hypothetical protein